MTKALLPLLLFLFATPLSGQLGFRTSVVFHDATDEVVTGLGTLSGPDFKPGSEIGLNYWFRLPKQRVEFLPELYASFSGIGDDVVYLNEYGAGLSVNVYPFDFLGDCDCPTFGKQGPQLQKGFFLQLSGGYAFYRQGSQRFSTAGDRGSSATLGAGLGLDIGLSNLVTLTPQAGVRYGLAPYQETVYRTGTNPEGVAYEPRLVTYHAGLRVSLRLDHKRY